MIQCIAVVRCGAIKVVIFSEFQTFEHFLFVIIFFFKILRYDSLLVVLISLLLAFVLATLPKWWRFISALGSSSRGRILRSSSNLDAIKMEGFMQVRGSYIQ